MTEKRSVFSSKIKYNGIFSFKDFYKFCYDYLTEELGFTVEESKYAEKISGTSKGIDIEWKGKTKVDDYFRYDIKTVFQILGLNNVEIQQDGKKIKTNKGSVEVKMKGQLVLDYKGEYATKPLTRFFRRIYEKWIIPSTVEKMEDKLIADCDEFLSQGKAYLDLEGRR